MMDVNLVWLQNQYFTFLENAPSISNNQGELHIPTTLIFMKRFFFVLFSSIKAPYIVSFSTDASKYLKASAFNTWRVKFTARTASVLEQAPLEQTATSELSMKSRFWHFLIKSLTKLQIADRLGAEKSCLTESEMSANLWCNSHNISAL